MIEQAAPSGTVLNTILDRARHRLRSRGWQGAEPALLVLGESQQLFCLNGDALLGQWRVSTGKAGFGCQEGSGCTPVGLHRIAACIGQDAPPGAVFKGRLLTGEILLEGYGPGTDLVTSRILWLEGLEPGLNQGQGIDSQQRYIYIHGTPQRALLGQPNSAGCVRMDPREMIDLFERVTTGTLILIWPTLPDDPA